MKRPKSSAGIDADAIGRLYWAVRCCPLCPLSPLQKMSLTLLARPLHMPHLRRHSIMSVQAAKHASVLNNRLLQTTVELDKRCPEFSSLHLEDLGSWACMFPA